MLKQLAWNTFKKTGNINTLMELVEVTNIEKDIQESIKQNLQKSNVEGNINEFNKDEGNSNFRK